MCFSNLYLYNICSTTTQPKYKLFTLSVSRDSLKMCSLKLTNYHLRHTEVSLSAYDNQKLVYFFFKLYSCTIKITYIVLLWNLRSVEI